VPLTTARLIVAQDDLVSEALKRRPPGRFQEHRVVEQAMKSATR